MITIRHKAWLACRSPAGLRRRRTVLPEDAGIGGGGAQVRPGGLGAQPLGVVPGGDQEQRGGVGADAVQGYQARGMTGDQGHDERAEAGDLAAGNSARRPSSRSAIRVW